MKTPTPTERARQAEHLKALKARPSVPPPPASDADDEADDEADFGFEPLSSFRLYSPKTLRQAMGIGRRYFNGLIEEGLPFTPVRGRHWFSGAAVIQWMESRSKGNPLAASGQSEPPAA